MLFHRASRSAQLAMSAVRRLRSASHRSSLAWTTRLDWPGRRSSPSRSLPTSSRPRIRHVVGSGFIPTTLAQIGGTNIPTLVTSATALDATIPASYLATDASLALTVLNGAPGGGTSTAKTIIVNTPNPKPTLTSVNPQADRRRPIPFRRSSACTHSPSARGAPTSRFK